MWATFAIIAFSVIGFALEKWSIEATALATLAAFLLLFSLAPGDAAGVTYHDLVMGFANPALITVLCLLMVGQALFNTDALDTPTRLLARISGTGITRTLLVLLGAAGAISAFLNNTPVVVMFIPVMTAIAAQRNFDAAKGLMPLSYICILGGMTTLIGSSTNLLVADVAGKEGFDIDFFDFTVPGLMLAAAGALYIIFVMPLILQRRSGLIDQFKPGTGRQFVSQIEITPNHPLLGIQSRLGLFPQLEDMTVMMVVRRAIPIRPPFEELVLSEGDVVIVAATRASLTKALSTGSANVPSHPKESEPSAEREIEPDFHLAEAIVSPGSRYVGRTVQGANIRFIEGVIVMGVQRTRRMQHREFREIRLEPGDTLLVGGTMEAISRLRSSRDLLLLEWSAAAVPLRRFAPRAIAIFLAVVATASTGLLPIMVASVLGVLAMIATRCLNVRQAMRTVDSRIFMLVAAALAGAVALEKTGGAAHIANSVVALFAGSPAWVVLSAFFLAIAVLTNFLSNNATAVLFTPIAIKIAQGIGAPPEAFISAVIFAANCSFATPVGYQTNLLVMGPGHYRFADFIKAGTPLVILIWLTYSFVGPWYYQL
ncbi:MAG: SLC13 family permease [Nitratireductor sp.]|nr:SLC13 family permease [Nitratireductor sp.]